MDVGIDPHAVTRRCESASWSGGLAFTLDERVLPWR